LELADSEFADSEFESAVEDSGMDSLRSRFVVPKSRKGCETWGTPFLSATSVPSSLFAHFSSVRLRGEEFADSAATGLGGGSDIAFRLGRGDGFGAAAENEGAAAAFDSAAVDL
jgi:hypothetical protein